MKRVDGVVGNVDDDPDLAAEIDAHEAAGTLETVVLDDTERKRSRLRVTTDAGTDLGVLVDQPELVAGDVLLCNDDRAVVVAFEEREAFVIEFPATEAAVSTGVELGHRIGNQHWDLAVEAATLYIPVEADRAIIEDVLGPYIPAGATTRYETVDAERFIEGDDDTAAADHGVDHDHVSDQSHDDHDHEHEHSHDHGHSHDHDHDHTDSATATGETR
ncbi:urease accessory protein UreE [Halonotius sp. GCM10025705]|uniref:urease accessory protein UreE n=1 Tax=Halonotius sp. GCM10025705 TaxID=3252678 RepID=UPI0036114DE0